jgi:hypothetical protein
MTAESIKSVNRDQYAQHLPRIFFLFVCDVHWCTVFPDSIKNKSCENSLVLFCFIIFGIMLKGTFWKFTTVVQFECHISLTTLVGVSEQLTPYFLPSKYICK